MDEPRNISWDVVWNTHIQDDIGLNVFVSWIVMACQVHNCHARHWISSKAQSAIDSVFVSLKQHHKCW